MKKVLICILLVLLTSCKGNTEENEPFEFEFHFDLNEYSYELQTPDLDSITSDDTFENLTKLMRDEYYNPYQAQIDSPSCQHDSIDPIDESISTYQREYLKTFYPNVEELDCFGLFYVTYDLGDYAEFFIDQLEDEITILDEYVDNSSNFGLSYYKVSVKDSAIYLDSYGLFMEEITHRNLLYITKIDGNLYYDLTKIWFTDGVIHGYQRTIYDEGNYRLNLLVNEPYDEFDTGGYSFGIEFEDNNQYYLSDQGYGLTEMMYLSDIDVLSMISHYDEGLGWSMDFIRNGRQYLGVGENPSTNIAVVTLDLIALNNWTSIEVDGMDFTIYNGSKEVDVTPYQNYFYVYSNGTPEIFTRYTNQETSILTNDMFKVVNDTFGESINIETIEEIKAESLDRFQKLRELYNLDITSETLNQDIIDMILNDLPEEPEIILLD